MNFKKVAAVLLSLLMITGCSSKVESKYDNIDKKLELNTVYNSYDLDNDGKKDTFKITHDANSTILTVNNKNAKYLYPYKDVDARLLRLSSGKYLISLTLKEATKYKGVTEMFWLKDNGLNRGIYSSNYQIGFGYFKTIKVNGNEIDVTMYIKDTHLDVILVPLHFKFTGNGFNRTSKFSKVTYITNAQNDTHTAKSDLYASVGVHGMSENDSDEETGTSTKDDDDVNVNDEAFSVKKGSQVTITRVYFTAKELYYEATLDGKKKGYIRCETALSPYFKDIKITE